MQESDETGRKYKDQIKQSHAKDLPPLERILFHSGNFLYGKVTSPDRARQS